MTTSKSVGLLQNIELNASVNMDDVVNVFISRYETGLHGQFTGIQASLKENGQKLAGLELEALAKIKEDFVKEDTILVSNGVFEIKQSYGEVTICWAESKVKLEIKTVTTACDGCNLIQYGDSDRIKTSFTVAVNLHEHFSAAYKRLAAEGTNLREQLMLVNQQLQQVDRKARQVKGFIAEKKLADAGMTELLENVELAQLIQIN